MPADNIFYRDAFIKCSVVKNEDNNPKLDIPFQIYHQTIIEQQNKNHYCDIPGSLADKEVLVYVHYAIPDENKVKAFAGYLGNNWKQVQKNPDVIKFWDIKKEDALAVKVYDKDNPSQIQKYVGTDKLDIVHPYIAEDMKTDVKVIKCN